MEEQMRNLEAELEELIEDVLEEKGPLPPDQVQDIVLRDVEKRNDREMIGHILGINVQLH